MVILGGTNDLGYAEDAVLLKELEKLHGIAHAKGATTMAVTIPGSLSVRFTILS